MRLAACALACLLFAACASKNPYYDPAKPHHRPDGFVNSNPAAVTPGVGFFEQIRRQLVGYYRPKTPPQGGYAAFAQAWSVKPDLEWLRANRTETTVTWLGHAGILLQMDGFNILMDPVFSDRASPVSWMGPPRQVPSPVQVTDLPPIDLVFISHNHYDHLDRPTVLALKALQPGARYLVPLGMKQWFVAEGITAVREIDWWDTVDAGSLRLHLTPAQHWSKRTAFDRNEALWGGVLVESRGAKPWRFLYTGDTGYSQDFVAIRKRLGRVDLAAIPIGSYEPRDFMRVQHTNPEDAVQILLDLEAGAAFGVHWGTFELTQEPFDQPPADLAAARAKLGVAPERFFVMKHGETRRISR
jgi:L-ascorbate metabolism protein UlaG (beta-lactamase superfamily)